jgi:hypothetical protein
MVTQYTKMTKDGYPDQNIEPSKVERFLSEGWQLVDQPKEEKKSQVKSSKNKISAKAQVTSDEKVVEEKVEDIKPTEEELDAVPCVECGSEEHSYKDCGEDNWTYSEDDFETAKKED